jgi:uncharacterized protein (TIGR00251 family)
MIKITERAEGCVIKVRAQPGARRHCIVGEHGDKLKVAVTAPADKGRANDAILGILAKAFGLKRSQVELLGGHFHHEKVILLHSLTIQEVRSKLRGVLNV